MQYLRNRCSKFYQNQVTCVPGLGEILLRFSDQKVKGQGYSRQKPVEFHLVNIQFLVSIIILMLQLSTNITGYLLMFLEQ